MASLVKTTITGTALATDPVLAINSGSSGSYLHMLEAFSSSMASGNTNILVFGSAGSTGNSAYIGYRSYGANNADNVLTLGHWGYNHLINIKRDGNVGIGTTSPAAQLDLHAGNMLIGDSYLDHHSTNDNYGLQIKSIDTNQVALELRSNGGSNAAGTWRTTLYATAQYYGFLDSAWGNWDIKKNVNGALQIDQGSGLETVLTTATGMSSSTAWANMGAGTRTNYTLKFQPPTNSYAGFQFLGTNSSNAGFFLVRGTSDDGVYTAEGITLVADQGWLTLAQRTTASKGVRIMTGSGASSSVHVRINVSTAGDIVLGVPTNSLAPATTTTLKGYSVQYDTGGAGERLSNTGFLIWHTGGSWTGNERMWAFTNADNMGGGGGPRFTLLRGSNNSTVPTLGNNGSLGTNTLRTCYWTKDGDFYNSGNIGIGAESPVGDLMISRGSSAGAEIQFHGTDTAYHRLGIRKTGSRLDMGEYNNDGDTLTPILTVDGDGDRVGIGTTDPGFKLHVAGGDVRLTTYSNSVYFGSTRLLGYDSSTAGNLWIIGGSGGASGSCRVTLGTGWNWDTSCDFHYAPGTAGAGNGILTIGQQSKNNANFTHGITRFFTKGAERVRINADGNVGIGTNSPATNLYVGSGTQSTANLAGIAIGNGASSYSYFSASDQTKQYIAGVDHSITYTKAGNVSNHDLSIITNNTNRIYIEAGGSVGIGTTDPSGLLTVYQGELTLVSSASYNTHLNYQNGGSHYITMANGGATYFRGSSNGITTMTVLGSGSVGIGGSPTAALDIFAANSSSIAIRIVGGNKTQFLNAANNTNANIYNAGSSGNSDLTFQISGTSMYVMTSGSFYPVANGAKDLGLSGNRWNNVYSEAGNFSGVVSAADITVSGSTPTITVNDTDGDANAATAFIQFQQGGTGIGKIGDLASGRSAMMLYAESGKELMFFTNGQNATSDTPAITINTSQNVGIGTASPDVALHVNSSSDQHIILSGSTNPYIRFQESSTSRAYIQWHASYDSLLFRNEQADNFDFLTHGTTGAISLRLKGSNHDVWGYVYAEEGSSEAHTVGFLDGDGAWAARHVKDTSWEWRINNSTKMFINSSGNVGIGTTQPSQKLDVNGNTELNGSVNLIGGNWLSFDGEQGLRKSGSWLYLADGGFTSGLYTRIKIRTDGYDISPYQNTASVTSATTLGLSTKRWYNVYSQAGNFSGFVIAGGIVLGAGNLTTTGNISGNGSGLTALNASNIGSGTINVARLGSGATSSKFLRGDNTWQTISSGSSPNNATITLSAGTNLSGGGDFTTNQSSNETITFNMSTGGAGAGSYGSTSDGTKIDTITLDAYGRVTAVATGNTGDILGVTAGSGLSGGGTSGTVTLSMGNVGPGAGSHGSTSNSTKIDTITLDAQGRVTAIATGATGSGSMSGWYWGVDSSTATYISNGETVRIKGGTNVTVSRSGNDVTINSSGGGGSGTVTSVATSTGLQGGTITTSGTLSVTGAVCMSINAPSGSAAPSSRAFTFSQSGGMSISASGSTVTFSSSSASDYRLKKNVTDFNSESWTKVKSVSCRKFDFDAEKFAQAMEDDYTIQRPASYGGRIGFIAHELEAAGIDGAVEGEKDGVDEDGVPIYQKVSYTTLVPVLWGALNEAIRKIEILESKVQALEDSS